MDFFEMEKDKGNELESVRESDIWIRRLISFFWKEDRKCASNMTIHVRIRQRTRLRHEFRWISLLLFSCKYAKIPLFLIGDRGALIKKRWLTQIKIWGMRGSAVEKKVWLNSSLFFCNVLFYGGRRWVGRKKIRNSRKLCVLPTGVLFFRER